MPSKQEFLDKITAIRGDIQKLKDNPPQAGDMSAADEAEVLGELNKLDAENE